MSSQRRFLVRKSEFSSTPLAKRTGNNVVINRPRKDDDDDAFDDDDSASEFDDGKHRSA